MMYRLLVIVLMVVSLFAISGCGSEITVNESSDGGSWFRVSGAVGKTPQTANRRSSHSTDMLPH